MTIDDQACLWAVRIDRGLSSSENADLAGWLSSDARCRGALLRAQAGWSILDRARALSSPDPERATPQLTTPSRRQVLRWGGGVAAALTAGLAWRLAPRGQRYATATGEIRRLPLQDGSTTVINSRSGIRVDFAGRERNVELVQGEAWFQVAKNPDRPFTVAAGQARVQAVGTAFAVRRRGEVSELVVSEGVVKVWSTSTDGAPLLVTANQRALISEHAETAVTELSADEADQRLAWREGKIFLDDLTLAEAAAEFNRYNETQLIVAPALAGRELVGVFRTDDLNGFVQATSALVGGHVRRVDKDIIIIER